MTALDDREHIYSADADEAQLRRKCREGTDKYAEALLAAGYIPAERRAA
jgi:hypothetical protein